MKNKGKNYKILSLDGGGIRGLITARILERLMNEPKIEGWFNDVKLIAGTSTGGILALALAADLKPKDICNLYCYRGEDIFEKDFFPLTNILSAKYKNENLKKELNYIFEKRTLGSLSKKVIIPTFDLDNEGLKGKNRTWKPKMFHNYDNEDSDASKSIVDVALYTSAAPTYFPMIDGFIDGGVFANNPSVIAIAQVLSHTKEKVPLSDISLLSIGTGKTLQYIDELNSDWGTKNWISPLIEILMEGVSGVTDYQTKQLLKDRYIRWQHLFPENEGIKLDDVKKLKQIEKVAKQANLEPIITWIKKYWLS